MQQVVLSFGLEALERGYAILVYDGPGQGVVIKQPPYMPFYPAWERVLAEVLAMLTAALESTSSSIRSPPLVSCIANHVSSSARKTGAAPLHTFSPDNPYRNVDPK